jgi:ABC-type lipoprotein release transport system permease subunit
MADRNAIDTGPIRRSGSALGQLYGFERIAQISKQGGDGGMLRAVRLGWRNLWRNRRRTAITLAAISFATGVLIVTNALLEGMIERTVRTATDLVVGEAQVHPPGYLADRSLYSEIENPETVLERARAAGIPAAPRSFGYGLVAHGTKSAGAMFWGVRPTLEPTVSDLAKHLRAGSFVAEPPRRRLVLGRKLARSLQAELGSEIVVVVQAADGSLGNELFSVGGILEGVGENLDRSGALIHHRDFDELFATEGRVHEIAFNTRGASTLDELQATLGEIAPGTEIKTWRALLPIVSDMSNMIGGAIWILSSIFLLAAGLGVLNTLLMAMHERIPELGVLKAIGTPPWRLIGDMATEAAVLGVLGTVVGGTVGIAGAWLLQKYGIDTSALAGAQVSIGGIAWDPIWRGTLTLDSIVVPVVLMWVVCLLASLFPAAIASRLDPVEAMRRRR